MMNKTVNKRPRARAVVLVAFAASVALPVVATELATDVLRDKDVILHLPLDSDFLSVSNSAANPTTVQTNLSSGGSVAFVKPETEGQFVVESAGAGRGRDNGGYLHISNSQVFLDLSKFGIGYGVTNITVEGYIRGTYPGSMAAWSGVLSMGAWTNLNEKIFNGSPFYVLLSPNSTDGQLYLRADGHLTDGSTASRAYGVSNGLNGEWHHFAMVITWMAKVTWIAGCPEGAMMRCYLDHKYIGANENEVSWHGHSETGDGRKLYLAFGSPSSTVDLDEIRISKGTLETHEFLRLRNRMPADGEEVLHMTFDGKDLASTVFTEDPPVQVSGTAPTGYATDVPGPYISNGRHGTAKRENTHSLLMNAAMLKLRMSNWLLGENGMRDLTLEFFIKGPTEPKSGDWAGPIGLASPDIGFPFLLQVENGNYYLRADLPYWNGTGRSDWYNNLICRPEVAFNDGKWHHVAMTVKERTSDTSSVAFYFDHKYLWTQNSLNHAWKGLPNNGYLRLGHGSAKNVLIDEVRISKGVLTKDQFMYARNGEWALFLK